MTQLVDLDLEEELREDLVFLVDLSAVDPSCCDCQNCMARHGHDTPCMYGNCPERLKETPKGRRPFHNEVPL